MIVLFSALQQMLIFLPLTLGIYISYRILAVVDLTVDGTFVLGAGIFAKLVTSDINQYLSILLAVLGGAIIGIAVALIQKAARINSLIASIIAVFMMFSLNFKVMGKPNISLLESSTLLANLQLINEKKLVLILLASTCLLIASLTCLLHSRLGLMLRAYGSNQKLLQVLGKNNIILLAFGLAISNGLAAFCGTLTAQINGYADLNMGMGVALTAIGTVVIGLHLIHKISRKNNFSALFDFFGCSLGTFIYFLVMNLLLYLGIDPIYLKLILGMLLIAFLAAANYTNKELTHA